MVFHFLKFSFYTFTLFIAILQNFRAWGRGWVWPKLVGDVRFFISQFSNFLIWMNNPSLESYYVAVFKYYAFYHFSCNFFADLSIPTSEKKYLDITQPHATPFDVFVIPIGHQWLISMWNSQKVKIVESTMLIGSVNQKLKEECLSVKIWIIIKKMYLR